MSSSVSLSTAAPDSIQADALVVLLAKGPTKGSAQPLGALGITLAAELEDAIAALRLTGDAEEVTTIPAPPVVTASVVVLSGIGEVEGAPEAEAVRRGVGAALRHAAGRTSVAVVAPAESGTVAAASAEGALLGSHTFTRYRAGDPAPEVTLLTARARTREVRTAVEHAEVVAAAVAGARDLVNTAPGDQSPAVFAELAVAAVKGLKVRTQVLDLAALRAGGYGGIVGVGQGSVNEPRLVTLSYSPARAKAHVALVGKGITFDSGGLSLKPPTGMITMKSDMAGAAAVLETVVAVARLGLPVRVTGLLAIAENMPSGAAQRPGDVLRMRGGKTVEVLNTDAEGRLVMADALVDAVALEPDVILDVATLTGAQLVALGPRIAGVMGTSEVRDAVVTAAGAAGEAAWPMPLPKDLRPGLDSTIADIANVGDKLGGMLTAGLFLQEFTGGRPWAHLDIAGPSFNEGKPWGYTPKGATGAAVRTLVSYLETVAG